MTILAWVYLGLMVLSYLAEPFWFGQERKPYCARDWFIKTLIAAPLMWLLFMVATGKV